MLTGTILPQKGARGQNPPVLSVVVTHTPAAQVGLTIGIAQPMGGHIGAGVAWQAASKRCSQFFEPACHSHPEQQANFPSVVVAVTTQSVSALHAPSMGGRDRVPVRAVVAGGAVLGGAAVATVATGATVAVVVGGEEGLGGSGSQPSASSRRARKIAPESVVAVTA